MWKETTLLTDRAVQFAAAKTDVFSDSVLCLGGLSRFEIRKDPDVHIANLA